MSRQFTLSCESTIDLPYSYTVERDISVIFYTYMLDGRECIDDMGRDPGALSRFYGALAAGSIPTTSQINVYRYTEYFESLLKRGGDILHVAFGSGMTPSVINAMEAAEALKGRYPGQKLTVVDSLCSSSGYGLLTDAAADMRDRGCSLAETEQWLLNNRNRVHHQFFSVDLKYYRRSGRISGAAATVAAILNICPIMRLNSEGRIVAYGKVRGKKNAIGETLRTMAEHAQNGTDYAGKCFICHSNCLADAQATRDAVVKQFPHIDGEVRICDIGAIIAAHCGPGTVAVFFFGDERAPGDGK